MYPRTKGQKAEDSDTEVTKTNTHKNELRRQTNKKAVEKLLDCVL